MQQRIGQRRGPRGNTIQTLRTWGLLFLAMGIAGQTIIQNTMLGVGQISMEELLLAMDDQNTMIWATVALVAQLFQTCAIPIFTFLLVQGVMHTSSFKNYALRVAGIALLAEIPFDLAMTGKPFFFGNQNPVLGLLLAMVVLWFIRHYSGKGFKSVLIGILVTVMAVFWVGMLRISDGVMTVVLVVIFWLTRRKLIWQVFAGACATLLCTMLSLLYFMAPMSFLLIHFYNEEPGEGNKAVSYFAYPALLLGLYLVGVFLF
ncbi:MAG: hypothetical protein IIV61_03720 [Oscillospiraceae bacterium]|jgi:hypothetical protein|nr:hypothetical protein [Oscillospiraceae bacterium]